MEPVDVCWARPFTTEYGRYRTKWLLIRALEQAYTQLAAAASGGRRSTARDSGVCVTFATIGATRNATSTFNARHTLSASGRCHSMQPSRSPASMFAICEDDVERDGEAGHPSRLHTGSRILTAPEFPGLLTAAEETTPQPDEDVEVNLLHPVPKAFEKLTPETERIEPNAPVEHDLTGSVRVRGIGAGCSRAWTHLLHLGTEKCMRPSSGPPSCSSVCLDLRVIKIQVIAFIH
jgi:hypothetical protein